MSSVVIKSKSKDKKAGKDQKTPAKSSVAVNGSNGISASAYNPTLGMFHALDTSLTSSVQVVNANGRFRNVDDSEDLSTHGSGGEFDSVSNNDTRSVESEEQNKDKSNASNKPEVIPGSDNDKREKIRQKNEKKHQRQKEKRAQELHERCSGYLMSRKLEALAQQLVSMGFSQERATMALILNEGRVEEAVAWLFEAGDDSDELKDQNLEMGNNLEIDISEELSRIADLEIKFKCSKQEVERAVVTCEGDLEKSEETLRSQKQDQPAVLPSSDETVNPPIFSNGKISIGASQSNVKLLQPKSNAVSILTQRRDDKDFNYTKPTSAVGPVSKSVPKPIQPVTRLPPNLEWARQQQIANAAEKRWPVGPLQVSAQASKVESRYVSVVNDSKNLQPGLVREPVVMIQRPQSGNTNPGPVARISSSPPGAAVNWYPSNSEALNLNGFLPHIPSTRSPSPSNLSSNQFLQPTQQYQQQHQYQQHQQNGAYIPFSSAMDNLGPSLINGHNSQYSRITPSPTPTPTPTLAPASSLGLFSGTGSIWSDPISSGNWKNSMLSHDYNSVDWSLDKSFPPSNPSSLYSSHMYDSGININLQTRLPSSNSNGVPGTGIQDGGTTTSADPSAATSREWSSPFEGRDLFSLPRQFVFSPSMQ